MIAWRRLISRAVTRFGPSAFSPKPPKFRSVLPFGGAVDTALNRLRNFVRFGCSIYFCLNSQLSGVLATTLAALIATLVSVGITSSVAR